MAPVQARRAGTCRFLQSILNPVNLLLCLPVGLSGLHLRMHVANLLALPKPLTQQTWQAPVSLLTAPGHKTGHSRSLHQPPSAASALRLCLLLLGSDGGSPPAAARQTSYHTGRVLSAAACWQPLLAVHQGAAEPCRLRSRAPLKTRVRCCSSPCPSKPGPSSSALRGLHRSLKQARQGGMSSKVAHTNPWDRHPRVLDRRPWTERSGERFIAKQRSRHGPTHLSAASWSHRQRVSPHSKNERIALLAWPTPETEPSLISQTKRPRPCQS